MPPRIVSQPVRQLLVPRFDVNFKNGFISLNQTPRRGQSTTSAPPTAPEDAAHTPSQNPGQASIPTVTPIEISVVPPSPPRKPRTPNGPVQVFQVRPGRDNSTPDKYLRLPRAVQALYLKPLRRVPTDGVPCCDLQLRSYSVRNLEFFADFAVRVAYYLKLPAFGPHPLPRITEKWTVPKSHFIFKKVQENFMRITHRRIIQIKDGHPDNVKLWLAYLTKNQYHGIGMKANVWEWSGLDVAGEMDRSIDAEKSHIDEAWKHLGDTKKVRTAEKVAELLAQERFKLAGGR